MLSAAKNLLPVSIQPWFKFYGDYYQILRCAQHDKLPDYADF